MNVMPISLGGLPVWAARSRSRPQPWSAALLDRRYRQAVLRYASARVGAGSEAEDVVAETFAAALARLDACPAPVEEGAEHDPARAWLLGIARRKVADALRQKTRRRETALSETLNAPASQRPEPQALADEAARTLQAILEGLPADQREALLLKYVDGLSLIEMGRVMGRSSRAASQLLYRAREAVRRQGATYFSAEETR
jgi:RNA polymerase sigma-70 factor, ECF subfamily